MDSLAVQTLARSNQHEPSHQKGVHNEEIDNFIDKVNFIAFKNNEEYDDDSDDYHRGYEDGVEACRDAINCM